MNFPDDYPEQLADLAGVLFDRLRRHGMSEDDAGRVAMDQVEAVRNQFVGGSVYMPKYNSQRDDEIWQKFNGKNHAELAKHYRLTVVRIYQILARERAQRQGVLPI